MPQKPASILVDSNLLLLLAVGLWNPRAIPSQKRLSNLTNDDFEVLRTFLSTFETIITTPHVLTEVSNLAGAASGQSRVEIFAQLASLCKILDERTLSAETISGRLEFRVFGLTDAVLSELCSQTPLLTQDGRLAGHLRNKGFMALTLQDVRILRHQANHA